MTVASHHPGFAAFASGGASSSSAAVPWQLALGGLGLLLVLVLLCCFQACRSCRTKDARRRSWRRASDTFGDAFGAFGTGAPNARATDEFEMGKRHGTGV